MSEKNFIELVISTEKNYINLKKKQQWRLHYSSLEKRMRPLFAQITIKVCGIKIKLRKAQITIYLKKKQMFEKRKV